MSFENIILSFEESWALIQVNRPKQLNALNAQTLVELEKAVSEAQQNKAVRSIIITGSGDKAFVAGADIAAMKEMKPAEAREFVLQGHRTMNAIENAACPVIAAVNGFALGGGTELALACDFIYASNNAKFGLPETKLGLFPGFGGTQRLPRVVGVAKAKEYIFSARVFGADEALAIGLANKVLEQVELLNTVKALCREIAGNGPNAVRFAKKVIFEGQNLSYQAALENEIKPFEQIFQDTDHYEGLSAFLEKRTAKFEGK